ncbi:MAG: septation ring formation regulator EzrA, partial [Bacilli bacterium]|nr:septation ring formation regulator EzrA [Bacilli bacterium]
MDNIILFLVTIYIITILVISIILFLIQRQSRNKHKKEILALDKQKNIVIDPTIMTELSKAESLIRNEKLKVRCSNWNKGIDKIKKEDVPKINDLILETEYSLDQKDYKNYLVKKSKTEIKIYEVREKRDKIFKEIQEITLSEDKNRAIVTDLKFKFREIIQIFENTKPDFMDLVKPIQLQIETIEKRFQLFEECMENQEYEDVKTIVKSLDTMIKHMQTVLDEVPSILLMSTNLIPKRIEEAKLLSNKMIKEGYQLDYLNIDYNIEEIEKKLKDSESKVRVLNLEDVLLELRTILEYFDSLYNDLEMEKTARKNFEEQIISFKSKINKINEVTTCLYGKVSDAKCNYELTKEQIKDLNEVTLNLEEANKDFNLLCDTKNTSSFPYSRLVKELELIMSKLGNIELKVNKYMQTVGNMQEDEKRAREQLEEIEELLKNTKYKIRDYNVPVIPNKYYVELDEAYEGIKEIAKELSKKPINIQVLNTRVDTARDLVFKFHNTTNELLKTSMMAENA